MSKEWLPLHKTHWEPKANHSLGSSLLLNFYGTTRLGDRILALIADVGRNDSLTAITPILDDDAAIEALLEAHGRGAKIKIITKLADHRSGKLHFVTRGDVFGENLEAHFRATRRLTLSKIRIKSLDLLPHAKLVVAKGRTAIFSSANLTSNSLGTNGSKSVEAGIIFDALPAVSGLAHLFNTLWRSSRYAQDLCESRLVIHTVPASPLRSDSLPEVITGNVELCWSYPPVNSTLRTRIVERVKSAKKEIIFAAMSFYDVDRIDGMEAAIKKALANRVKVTAIVRPEQFTLEQYPDLSTRRLMDAGLRLLGVTGLHAKGFLIDDDYCGILSANFNPYSLGAVDVASNLEMALCGSPVTPPFLPFAHFLRDLQQNPTHCFKPITR